MNFRFHFFIVLCINVGDFVSYSRSATLSIKRIPVGEAEGSVTVTRIARNKSDSENTRSSTYNSRYISEEDVNSGFVNNAKESINRILEFEKDVVNRRTHLKNTSYLIPLVFRNFRPVLNTSENSIVSNIEEQVPSGGNNVEIDKIKFAQKMLPEEQFQDKSYKQNITQQIRRKVKIHQERYPLMEDNKDLATSTEELALNSNENRLISNSNSLHLPKGLEHGVEDRGTYLDFESDNNVSPMKRNVRHIKDILRDWLQDSNSDSSEENDNGDYWRLPYHEQNDEDNWFSDNSDNGDDLMEILFGENWFPDYSSDYSEESAEDTAFSCVEESIWDQLFLVRLHRMYRGCEFSTERKEVRVDEQFRWRRYISRVPTVCGKGRRRVKRACKKVWYNK